MNHGSNVLGMTTSRYATKGGDKLWGPYRQAAGIGLRDLEKRCGIGRGFLSLMEHGRMFPTGEEFNKVMASIKEMEAEKG
jgi:hypothetical protein